MPMTALTNPTSPFRSTPLPLSFLPLAALAAVLLAAGSGDEPSATQPFLLTRTDAHVVVTGLVAHTVVLQEWENPNRTAAMRLAPVAFRRIVLVEADGSRVTVEEDGEVWWSAAATKRLVRALTAEAMAALRSALARADAGNWQPGDATGAFGRSRLAVLLESGETRSVALPPPGFEGQRLLALLRAFASGT
jgi:hypothetical protein